MIPDQTRAVDPFSSYESDNVNKITRLLTAGEDRIAREVDLAVTKLNDTTLRITDGVAIKDDLMIHVKESNLNGYTDFDVTIADNYIVRVGESGLMDGAGDAYMVLDYQYAKVATAPEAKLMLLKDPVDFTTDLYVFLAKVTFSATNVVSVVVDNDGAVIRKVANLVDGYTDVAARAADATNPVTNHQAAAASDYNKIITTNKTTGDIELQAPEAFLQPGQNLDLEWPVSETPVLVTHNLGIMPLVQIIDNDTGSSDKGEVISAIVKHTDTNCFTVDFAPPQSSPFDFRVTLPIVIAIP
jgi:hypothetical protein